jgi:hypothetical protein
VIGVILAGTVMLSGFVVTFSGVSVRGRLVGLTLMAGGALLGLSVGWPAGSTPLWTTLVAVITLAGMLGVAFHLARRRDRHRPSGAGSGGADDADPLDAERP